MGLQLPAREVAGDGQLIRIGNVVVGAQEGQEADLQSLFGGGHGELRDIGAAPPAAFIVQALDLAIVRLSIVGRLQHRHVVGGVGGEEVVMSIDPAQLPKSDGVAAVVHQFGFDDQPLPAPAPFPEPDELWEPREVPMAGTIVEVACGQKAFAICLHEWSAVREDGLAVDGKGFAVER